MYEGPILCPSAALACAYYPIDHISQKIDQKSKVKSSRTQQISRLSNRHIADTGAPGTAMEGPRTISWRGNPNKKVTIHAVRNWTTSPPEISDGNWIYCGQCEVSGIGIFEHRTEKGRFQTGPCPEEPGPTETAPPKKEATATPMAQKAKVHAAKESTPPEASASAKTKASAPVAPKAAGSTKPSAKPNPVSSKPARSSQETAPKPSHATWPRGCRSETKSGPSRPNQQNQQPSTKVEPCWHFERNHGRCPWKDRCWFGHVKKSRAKKRREARARQRARARNAEFCWLLVHWHWCFFA